MATKGTHTERTVKGPAYNAADGSSAKYGAQESNGLGIPGSEFHACYFNAPTVEWTDERLAKITRLRLLSDPGFAFWDISYCYGTLKDGSLCKVELPFAYGQLPKRGMHAAIVKAATKDGVYAKGLGIFEAISTLI